MINNTEKLKTHAVAILLCIFCLIGTELIAENDPHVTDIAMLKEQLTRLEQEISKVHAKGDTDKADQWQSVYNCVQNRMQLLENGIDPLSIAGLQSQAQKIQEELSVAEEKGNRDTIDNLISAYSDVTNEIAQLQLSSAETTNTKPEHEPDNWQEADKVRREAPTIVDSSLTYSNSLRVIEVINLRTNYTAAIEKYMELFGAGESGFLNQLQEPYANLLSIALSNDELLEIVDTYPNVTNKRCIEYISDIQEEAYRNGVNTLSLLENSAFVEAAKKASNPDLTHEERIRILDAVPLDVKGGIIGPNRVAGD